MMGIMEHARVFGDINRSLEKMVKDGFQPNVVTYNLLIHNYGRSVEDT